MQRVLAVDKFASLFFSYRFSRAGVGRLHKGDIVHPQACEIILV